MYYYMINNSGFQTESIPNIFTRLRRLPLTYFYVICKYYKSGKYGRVLGYPIQYYQREIHLGKSPLRLPVYIFSMFIASITKL